MREFFKRWRRKVGCITLVIALTLMGMWVRSGFVCDFVVFYVGDYSCVAGSVNNQVRLWSWKSEPGSESFDFRLGVKVTDGLRNQLDQQQEDTFEDFVLIMPYWRLTISLTLLSAYLILWTPRKRTEPHHA